MAYEYGREMAIKSLRKEQGADREFTEDEIAEETERLEEEEARLFDYI